MKAPTYKEMIYKITKVIADLYDKNSYLLSESLFSENERMYYKDIKIGMNAELATDAIHSIAGFMQRYYNQKVIIGRFFLQGVGHVCTALGDCSLRERFPIC